MHEGHEYHLHRTGQLIKVSKPVKIIYISEWARRDLSASKDFMDLCTGAASGKTRPDLSASIKQSRVQQFLYSHFARLVSREDRDMPIEESASMQLSVTIRCPEEFFYSIVKSGLISSNVYSEKMRLSCIVKKTNMAQLPNVDDAASS